MHDCFHAFSADRGTVGTATSYENRVSTVCQRSADGWRGDIIPHNVGATSTCDVVMLAGNVVPSTSNSPAVIGPIGPELFKL